MRVSFPFCALQELELQHTVFIILKIRAPCTFPIISVQICKICMIAAPEYVLRFFDDGSAGISYQFNDFIDLMLAVNIVRQCNTTETIADLGRVIGVNVLCQ